MVGWRRNGTGGRCPLPRLAPLPSWPPRQGLRGSASRARSCRGSRRSTKAASLIDELFFHGQSLRIKGQVARFSFDFVDELPKTVTGKIQRYKLREVAR